MDEPTRSPADDSTGHEDAGKRCLFCGQPMPAPEVTLCPHCGRPVAPPGRGDLEAIPRTLTQPSVPTQTDLGGPIPLQWALRCTRCGYNLTGLIERRCPECGQRFHPRETWLTNRRLTAARGLSWPPAQVMVALVCVPLVGSLMILFPPLTLLVILWLLLEWYCGRAGVNPAWLRVCFAAALVLMLVILAYT